MADQTNEPCQCPRCGRMHHKMPFMLPDSLKEKIEVGAVIERMGHKWKVEAVYLGGEGTESLVEISNVNHRNGYATNKRQRHMFVPEVLLRIQEPSNA